MNRVIKFRVWEKLDCLGTPSGRWYSPENQNQLWKDHDNESPYILSSFYNAERFEMSQFTGLTLPNGQEVYEGDILNTKAARWEVVFENGAFRVRTVWSQVYGVGHIILLSDVVDHAIPLGNRFENPDLLTL